MTNGNGLSGHQGPHEVRTAQEAREVLQEMGMEVVKNLVNQAERGQAGEEREPGVRAIRGEIVFGVAVDVGMRFALENPEWARRLVDRADLTKPLNIRQYVEHHPVREEEGGGP